MPELLDEVLLEEVLPDELPDDPLPQAAPVVAHATAVSVRPHRMSPLNRRLGPRATAPARGDRHETDEETRRRGPGRPRAVGDGARDVLGR